MDNIRSIIISHKENFMRLRYAYLMDGINYENNLFWNNGDGFEEKFETIPKDTDPVTKEENIPKEEH